MGICACVCVAPYLSGDHDSLCLFLFCYFPHCATVHILSPVIGQVSFAHVHGVNQGFERKRAKWFEELPLAGSVSQSVSQPASP